MHFAIQRFRFARRFRSLIVSIIIAVTGQEKLREPWCSLSFNSFRCRELYADGGARSHALSFTEISRFDAKGSRTSSNADGKGDSSLLGQEVDRGAPLPTRPRPTPRPSLA